MNPQYCHCMSSVWLGACLSFKCTHAYFLSVVQSCKAGGGIQTIFRNTVKNARIDSSAWSRMQIYGGFGQHRAFSAPWRWVSWSQVWATWLYDSWTAPAWCCAATAAQYIWHATPKSPCLAAPKMQISFQILGCIAPSNDQNCALVLWMLV